MDEEWTRKEVIKRKGFKIVVVGSIPTLSGLPPLLKQKIPAIRLGFLFLKIIASPL